MDQDETLHDDDDEWICRARHKTRCRSDALPISQRGGPSDVKGERVAVRSAADKLFQMTGPATAKLLIPAWSLFLIQIVPNPVRADRRCLLPAIAEIARQSSAK